jgi:hypothetical protein
VGLLVMGDDVGRLLGAVDGASVVGEGLGGSELGVDVEGAAVG